MKTRTFAVWLLFLAFVTAACLPQATQTISLFYYNPELDVDDAGNILCSKAGLVPVRREVPAALSGIQLIEEAINLLISGELRAEERAQGLTTEFPLDGVTLEEVSLVDGEATLTFADPDFRTSGGACRAGILWGQIEETALQFPGVLVVRFQPEELFQP